MKKLQIVFLFLLVLILGGCSLFSTTLELTTHTSVSDTLAPIVSLNGDEEVFVYLNKSYEEQGCSAVDNLDDDLDITYSGDVDTSTLGTYQVMCRATDSSGNVSSAVMRTVQVVNKRPGIILSPGTEYFDYTSVVIQTFDYLNLFGDLNVSIYEEGTLIESSAILSTMSTHVFDGLEEDVDYEIIISGTYYLNESLGYTSFETEPLNVGTYKHLPDSYFLEFEDQEKAAIIDDLVYLSYFQTYYLRCENAVDYLFNIETPILQGLLDNGEHIMFVPGAITNLADYSYLLGIEARGTGVNYEEVSGVCCWPIAVVSDNDAVTQNVLIHEVGHAFDYLLYQGISSSEEWLALQAEEKESLFPGDDYCDYPEEYFAECFKLYYLGDTTRSQFEENAPNTFAFMEQLINDYVSAHSN